jgi:prepilin-type N-terminal cleavage/methylation domain-containing protein
MTGSIAPKRRRRAFTLVEVMTALALAGIISAATLSTVVTLGRSGATAASYLAIDRQTASALRWFARDVRMARDLIWNSAASITLVVPDNYAATANRVTYGWDEASSSPTFRCFYRMAGDANAGNPRLVLARNVTALAFARYDRLNAPTNDTGATKRVEISLALGENPPGGRESHDRATATFILRNKTGS